ncbi:hypothetical protein [Actinomadura parmotrematis]|uniref:Lipoprotein n=1 Tax=Actinomadura parmotrematis TaxID=2864039 RepID=A0ABS7FUK0_9ACTN|nr:hypothetical protein [Actinomadura parmotrematis]MBW8483188.1 hypothetical protein [Actinomadura parmotrematis]
MRVRSTASLACAVLGAALALTACGGGEKKDATLPPPPPTTLAPLPTVRAADVKPLVGRWVGAQKDYFQFAANGTGVWVLRGKEYWKGTAIPDGKDKYRFSWEGGDPQKASYWGVTLTDGGTKLLFAGTGQTYTKSKGKGAPKSTAKATPTAKAAQ